MVIPLAEEISEHLATKEFVRADLANLRRQMLTAHVTSFIGFALLIVSDLTDATPGPRRRG